MEWNDKALIEVDQYFIFDANTIFKQLEWKTDSC